MRQKDSPPRLENQEDEFDEEDMVYVGDIDEVIEDLEGENEERMDDEGIDEDDAITVFKRHSDSVFCGSLTNDGKIAATGGQDDIAYMWNTSTGEVICECKGHKDSVIFAEFSHDNSYLVTGDMKGIIYAWRTSDTALLWQYEMGDSTWMKWHNLANVLFAGSDDGEIYMWKIPSGDCKVFQGYGQRPETACLVPDGKRLIVGYEDGSIRVIDLKEGSVQVTIAANSAHSAAITDLDCHSDGNLIISAAVDGKTVLSTTQTGKIVALLQNLQGKKAEKDEENINKDETEAETEENWVEAVAFCQNLAASGTVNGEIFIWDIVKQVMRHRIIQESGISKLVWKGTSPFLFSAGLDGVLRYYDARVGECVKSLHGHSEDILYLYISRDGTRALTTSDDHTARIFDITNC